MMQGMKIQVDFLFESALFSKNCIVFHNSSLSYTNKIFIMSSTGQKSSYRLSITIIGALFFIFGFVTWINGTLIPYLKIACELKTDLQSYLIAFAFFIAYTVMAIPSSLVLKKVGYKR